MQTYYEVEWLPWGPQAARKEEPKFLEGSLRTHSPTALSISKNMCAQVSK